MRKIYEEQLEIKFENPLWNFFPQYAAIDEILNQNPSILDIVSVSFDANNNKQQRKRKKTMTIEQIFRSALYLSMENTNYEELEKRLIDSKICREFCKMGYEESYKKSALHSNISKIKPEVMDQVFYEISRIGIKMGVDTGENIRQDTTTIESEIHHPTNSSLLYDCIRKSNDYVEYFFEKQPIIKFRDYRKGAKKNDFKIVNIKGTKKASSQEQRLPWFKKQMILFTKSENQMKEAIEIDLKSLNLPYIEFIYLQGLQGKMTSLLQLMKKIRFMSQKKEIENEKVSIGEKIFSIFETHTDCISKGSRDVVFGHKLSIASGKSNLLFELELLNGNPADTDTYQNCIGRIYDNYRIIPKNMVADGGYASKANHEFASSIGIKNNVFNKIKGSMQNIVSSKKMETMLKKWRAGIEAIISNLKRGLGLNRCNWKGLEQTKSYIKWAAIAFNMRVMAKFILT